MLHFSVRPELTLKFREYTAKEVVDSNNVKYGSWFRVVVPCANRPTCMWVCRRAICTSRHVSQACLNNSKFYVFLNVALSDSLHSCVHVVV